VKGGGRSLPPSASWPLNVNEKVYSVGCGNKVNCMYQIKRMYSYIYGLMYAESGLGDAVVVP
jgi:hypothetical protein